MAIRIPEHQLEAFGRLLRLSSSEWDAVINALQKATPAIPMDDFSENVASHLGVLAGRAKDVVLVLASMLSLRDNFPAPVEKLLDELRNAARSKELKFSEDEWNCFATHLRKFFAAETALETVAKAQNVTYEEQRILIDSRIITDLRPVFRQQIGSKPEAFIVTHALRIAYHENEQTKEMYFALDKEDLKKLHDVVARAIQKEATLKNVVKSTTVPVLDVLNNKNS